MSLQSTTPDESVAFKDAPEGFSEALAASDRRTIQGKLFDIGCHHPEIKVSSYALRHYTCERGYLAFSKIIEKDNSFLIKSGIEHEFLPKDLRSDRVFDFLGRRANQRSHQLLVHFHKEPYHYVIRTLALNAMSLEGRSVDSRLVLEILRNSDTMPPLLVAEAIYVLGVTKISEQKRLNLLVPFLMNKHLIVRQMVGFEMTEFCLGWKHLKEILEGPPHLVKESIFEDEIVRLTSFVEQNSDRDWC